MRKWLATSLIFVFPLFLAAHSKITDSPWGSACPQSGQAIIVSDFPSSAYQLQPFTSQFRNPPIGTPVSRSCVGEGSTRRCMQAYLLEITAFATPQFGQKGPETVLIGYNGTFPGPTFVVPKGTQTVVRVINKLVVDHNITYAKIPQNNSCTNTSRKGYATSLHNHAQMSLAAYDGWAEDVTCFGEYKDYWYPNNIAKTGWYHDHAASRTALNAYYGLQGIHIVSDRKSDGGCGEPWGLELVEELHMALRDAVFDSNNQLFYDPADRHAANLYGDVNLISGIPWPVVNVDPKAYRLRLLGMGPSRSWLIQIRDELGNLTLHQDICWIVASDGGLLQQPIKMPAGGLFIDVGERYEVVCNFHDQAGKILYLYNERDPVKMVGAPYFCLSHLLAKVVVSADAVTGPGASRFPPSDVRAVPAPWIQRLLSPQVVALARNLAQKHKCHRTFTFDFVDNRWVINQKGWMDEKMLRQTVSLDAWEVWCFTTPEGWYHPIHLHLVDFYVLNRNGRRPEPYERLAIKDVVHLDSLSSVSVVARFGPHLGPYMFHCHNLVHEDHDMMRAFKIVNAPSSPARRQRQPAWQRLVANLTAGTDPLSVPPESLASAKPLTQQVLRGLLARDRLYRIFYPDASDTQINTQAKNPWMVPAGCPAVPV